MRHLANHDFSPAIACAVAQPGVAEDAPEETITIGFARNTVMSVADTLLGMIGRGEVKNLFCQVVITQNGEPIVHNLGTGRLRIDRPLAPSRTTATPARA